MTSIWHRVAAVLAAAGCDAVVGLPSDEPGLLDAAIGCPGLRAVVVRDQRAGACVAVGHALVSGTPAVLAMTPGPALPNALVGLLEGASLCVPLVVVTTRVPRAGIGRGGFQETDQQMLAQSFAKWYHLVGEPEQLSWALRHAVHLAVNGRPGITVVEIEHEVTEANPPVAPEPPAFPVRRLRCVPERDDLAAAAAVMAQARRPVVVLGGGARAASAGSAVTTLTEVWPAAVLTTAAGRGVISEDTPYACGLIGLYLTPPMDSLVADADAVVAVGTRLEETARMRWSKPHGSLLIQVDCDPATFGVGLDVDIALLGDAALTLAALRDLLAVATPEHAATVDRTRWGDRISRMRAAAQRRWCAMTFDAAPVAATLTAVSDVFAKGATIVHENGLHDIWSYHWPVLTIRNDNIVVVPGEQTMMGFGVAAAVGAALADPTRVTVVLCGDGALGMSLTGLTTAVEQHLGVVVVVFDNAGFGWPRLLRQQAGASDAVTTQPVELPFESFVCALGGEVLTPNTDTELWVALRRARARAEDGQLSVLRIRVDDSIVPPGVEELYRSAQNAGTPS